MGIKTKVFFGSFMVLVGLLGIIIGETPGKITLGVITFGLGVINIVLGFLNAYMQGTKKYMTEDKGEL